MMDVENSWIDWLLFSFYQLIVLISTVAISCFIFLLRTYGPHKPVPPSAPIKQEPPAEPKAAPRPSKQQQQVGGRLDCVGTGTSSKHREAAIMLDKIVLSEIHPSDPEEQKESEPIKMDNEVEQAVITQPKRRVELHSLADSQHQLNGNQADDERDLIRQLNKSVKGATPESEEEEEEEESDTEVLPNIVRSVPTSTTASVNVTAVQANAKVVTSEVTVQKVARPSSNSQQQQQSDAAYSELAKHQARRILGSAIDHKQTTKPKSAGADVDATMPPPTMLAFGVAKN